MQKKKQIIITSILFIAGIACLINLIFLILRISSPWTLGPIIAIYSGQEAYMQFTANIIQLVRDLPEIIIEALLSLLGIIIFILASKKIKKTKRVRLWLILSFITSLLINDNSFLFIAGILGATGSVLGLIYNDEE